MASYVDAVRREIRGAVADGMPTANAQGKYLQLQFTADDPKFFNMPCIATMTYRNAANSALDWNELTCAENIAWYPGRDSDVPQAKKADF